VSAAEIRDLLADFGLEAWLLIQKTQHLLLGVFRAPRFGAAGRGVPGPIWCRGALYRLTIMPGADLFTELSFYKEKQQYYDITVWKRLFR